MSEFTGARKDPPGPMLQDEADGHASSGAEAMNGSGKPVHLRELLLKHRHEEHAHESSEWSEDTSMKANGRSSHHLEKILKEQKTEEQEKKEQQQDEDEDDEYETFHDPTVNDGTSDRQSPTPHRPITLYHRSLFKFKLSCQSPSAASDATSSPNSLRQLFRRESPREVQDFHHGKARADDFWWKKAMRMTMHVFRRLRFSVKRCYRSSAECCAAGLNYRGFGNANSGSGSGSWTISRRSRRRQELGDLINIRKHFAASLDSVREARPMDCARDQCGWTQEYTMSSPAQFSWESTPTYSDTINRQLLHRHQYQPSQSTISTITTTTELNYSSNLMTPYEIQHSFRRTFSFDDAKSCSEAVVVEV